MMRFLLLLGLPMIVLFHAESKAFADGWTGNWNTTYGQLRLIQDGPRIYGDYAERGTIEGVVNEAETEARAVYLYTDGRWGLVRWTRSSDSISGYWNWSTDGIPSKNSGKSWNGTRTSSDPSDLKYARAERIAVPEADPQFTENDFATWIHFADEIACCAPARDPAAGTGKWYSGLENTLTESALDLSIDITHPVGLDTGSASVSIYVPPNTVCQQDMQPGFCEELERLRGANGYVEVKVTGQRVVPYESFEQFLIAFRLPGDSQDRLISVREELNYKTIMIWSRSRGRDLIDFARVRQHMCEAATCSQQVPRDIEANQNSYRGALANPDWAMQLMATGTTRNRDRQPIDSGSKRRDTGTGRALLSDTLSIYDDRGDPLGAVRFAPDSGNLTATGELIGFFGREGPSETEFRFLSQTGEAVTFAVTIFAGQSGERRTGRMMVELPSQANAYPRGTLVLDDEITLIELDPAGPGYEYGRNENRRQPGRQDPPNADSPDDQPGIGVYKYTYRFRDVPLGRSVKLREGPSRADPETAMISAETGEMQILTCSREIDNIRFEEVSRADQLRILSAHWCEISTTDGRRGWLPARYLAPEQN